MRTASKVGPDNCQLYLPLNSGKEELEPALGALDPSEGPVFSAGQSPHWCERQPTLKQDLESSQFPECRAGSQSSQALRNHNVHSNGRMCLNHTIKTGCLYHTLQTMCLCHTHRMSIPHRLCVYTILYRPCVYAVSYRPSPFSP